MEKQAQIVAAIGTACFLRILRRSAQTQACDCASLCALTITETTMNNPLAAARPHLILSAIAVIMLAAPSGAALAQSAEYRRGYDEGYRAGMDAARSGEGREGRGGRGQGEGGRRRIIIEDAVYGDRDGSCDARPAVQAMVDRQRDPLIRADNRLCGDPAPRRGKSLEITYRCGDGRMLRTALREDTQAVLTCRN